MKWLLELLEFDIQFKSKKAMKGKAFADFVAKMKSPAEVNEETTCTIFIDASSSSKGKGAGVII